MADGEINRNGATIRIDDDGGVQVEPAEGQEVEYTGPDRGTDAIRDSVNTGQLNTDWTTEDNDRPVLIPEKLGSTGPQDEDPLTLNLDEDGSNFRSVWVYYESVHRSSSDISQMQVDELDDGNYFYNQVDATNVDSDDSIPLGSPDGSGVRMLTGTVVFHQGFRFGPRWGFTVHPGGTLDVSSGPTAHWGGTKDTADISSITLFDNDADSNRISAWGVDRL